MDINKKSLRKLLLENKNGIPLNELDKIYTTLVGAPIKYQSADLLDYLRSIPDTVRLEKTKNDFVVFGVSNLTNPHIQRLVDKQRTKKKTFMVRPLRVPRKPNNFYEDENEEFFLTNSNSILDSTFINLRNNDYNDNGSDRKSAYYASKKKQLTRKEFSTKNVLIDFKSELLKYTKRKNLPTPIYKSLILSKNHKKRNVNYVTKLTIGTDVWLSYPDLFTNLFSAESNASQKALESLKAKETLITNNSLLDISKSKLLDEIVNLLKENGENKSFFDNIIPKLYKEKYNNSLPSNWFDILSEFPDIIKLEKFEFSNNVKTIISLPLEKNNLNKPEIFKYVEPKVKNNDLLSIIKEFNSFKINKHVQELPPNLVLEEKDWTINVIKATNSNELIIKLDNFANDYDELIVSLYEFYVKNNCGKKVNEIYLKTIYAAVFEEAVFRVKALQLEGDQVNCFFLDDGIHEKVSKANLFEIENKFMKLPFQAFSVKLKGLEDFLDTPRFKKFFDDKINKSEDSLFLVARPVSLLDPIKIMLYDTHEENDISLNDKLIEYLKKSEKDSLGCQNPVSKAILPEIKNNPKCETDFFKVMVSFPANPQNFIVRDAKHVKEDSKFMKLNKEMQDFYNNEELIELNPSLIYNGSFICVKDSDNNWYRARVESVNDFGSNIKVTCYLIDIGKIIIADFNNIQPLFSHYSDFPMIAIRASLNDVLPLKDDWDAITAYEFTQLVDGKFFDSIVHSIIWIDSEPILNVSLLDRNSKQSISKYLVEKNFALLSND